MKVFLAVTSLSLDYGGPAFSVPRLASALAEAGVEVGVWAPDNSAASTPNLPVDSSVQRLEGSAHKAFATFGCPDIVHDNGIWLPHNHRLAQLASKHSIPRIISLRGMLEPWSLRHKQLKKRFAWWFYQRWDLKSAQCHHATAEEEALNVERLRLGVPVCVIPNGVDLPEFSPYSRHVNLEKAVLDGRKTALFLGRINPKKGLLMLVEAWARVRPPEWRLLIAGPDEAGYKGQIEKAVQAAGLSDVISFEGSVHGCAKTSIFFDSNLLVLPTHSENFGMVLVEALAHGLPVLTTTGAPWSGLPRKGCGWWVDASVDGISDGLKQATLLDLETLRAMGIRGREWVEAEFGWRDVAKRFMATYQDLLAKR